MIRKSNGAAKRRSSNVLNVLQSQQQQLQSKGLKVKGKRQAGGESPLRDQTMNEVEMESAIGFQNTKTDIELVEKPIGVQEEEGPVPASAKTNAERRKARIQDELLKGLCHTVDGKTFSETELLDVIHLSEAVAQFSMGRFLRFFFYHLVFAFLSPVVAWVLIFIMEGFSINTMLNMNFIGCSSVFTVQFLTSVANLVLYYVVYHLYRLREEAIENGATEEEALKIFDWRDYIHFVLIIFCRQLIIGIKYGFFSDQHYKILNQCHLRPEFLNKSLIIATLLNQDPAYIFEMLQELMEKLDIAPDQFAVLCHKNQCRFRILDYENTKQRLLLSSDSDFIEALKESKSIYQVRGCQSPNPICTPPDKNGECLMEQFLNSEVTVVFGDLNEVIKQSTFDKLENFYFGESNCDQVCCKRLAIEMALFTRRSLQGTVFLKLMMFSMVQTVIFYAHGWYRQTEVFTNPELRWPMAGPQFFYMMTYTMNLALIEGLVQLFNQKMVFKSFLLAMLDRDSASTGMRPIFPCISLQSPKSIMQYLNLVRLMAALEKSGIKRGSVYVPVLLAIYMSQFLFICLQVIMREQAISEQGELFVIYSVFNLIMTLLELNQILYFGSQTNRLDEFIQTKLITVRQECFVMKLFLQSAKLILKPGHDEMNFHNDRILFVKSKADGTLVDLQTNQEVSSKMMKEGKDITAQVNEGLEDFQQSLEQSQEEFSHFIETGSLEFLEQKIGFDLISTIYMIIFTLALSFAEKMIQTYF